MMQPPKKAKKVNIRDIKKEPIEYEDIEQKGAESVKVNDNNWTDSETFELLQQISKQIEDDEQHITCSRRMIVLDWTKVKIGKRSEKECISHLKHMTENIPRYRTLNEVLAAHLLQRYGLKSIDRLLQLRNDAVIDDSPMTENFIQQPQIDEIEPTMDVKRKVAKKSKSKKAIAKSAKEFVVKFENERAMDEEFVINLVDESATAPLRGIDMSEEDMMLELEYWNYEMRAFLNG